ncbi:hypothetical protein V8C44DRAFT_320669 [Trichoderma aethiopicum]
MPWPRQISPADAAADAADGGGRGTGSVGEPHHGPTSCRLRRTTAEDSRGQQHVAHTVRKRKHRRPRPAAAASTYLLVDELPGQARPGHARPSHTCSCRHTHPEQAIWIPCRHATLISKLYPQCGGGTNMHATGGASRQT